MELIEYLNAIPLEARDSFAERCGTSFDYLRQVGYGNRKCTEGLAMHLERESGKVLICEDLCPAADWSVVRGTALPSEPSPTSTRATRRQPGPLERT